MTLRLNLNSLHPRMFCANLNLNWLSISEKDEIVDKNWKQSDGSLQLSARVS